MINILIKKTKDNSFKEIEIAGHVTKEKLVCAGISAVVYGFINALEEINKNNDYKILVNNFAKNNKIKINVLNITKTSNLLFKVFVIQLNTVKYSYNDKIQIKEQNV